MLAAPSFRRVNYSIRPNKNVERKLIFESLRGLEHDLSLSRYRYIGFGSMWFSDFILAHRVLGIDDMISIERDSADAARAEFNKPFRTIRVEPGEASQVLPELALRDHKSVVWLDYDSGFEGPAWNDVAVVAQEAPSGSFLFVTINATPPRNKDGKEAKLRKVLGSLVPSQLSTDYFDKVPACFPANLASLMTNNIVSAMVRAGRVDEAFVPLFNFFYSDGAPMITLGGVIADATVKSVIDAWRARYELRWVAGSEQYVIDVPHLTPKEKIACDQEMPSIEPFEPVRSIPLTPDQWDAYRRHYRHYPLFAEFVI